MVKSLQVLQGSGPQHQGPASRKTNFPWTGKEGMVSDDSDNTFIVHFISVIIYYYVSSTANHQALDLRGWGSLLEGTDWWLPRGGGGGMKD